MYFQVENETGILLDGFSSKDNAVEAAKKWHDQKCESDGFIETGDTIETTVSVVCYSDDDEELDRSEFLLSYTHETEKSDYDEHNLNHIGGAL